MKTEKEVKHTPTPLPIFSKWVDEVNGQKTSTLEEVAYYGGINRELIIRAVNSHEANEYLAKVVEDIITKKGKKELSDAEALGKIAQAYLNRKAAIDRAEGK